MPSRKSLTEVGSSSSKSDRQEADLLRPKLTVAGRDTRIGSSEFTAVQVDCEISLEKALYLINALMIFGDI